MASDAAKATFADVRGAFVDHINAIQLPSADGQIRKVHVVELAGVFPLPLDLLHALRLNERTPTSFQRVRDPVLLFAQVREFHVQVSLLFRILDEQSRGQLRPRFDVPGKKTELTLIIRSGTHNSVCSINIGRCTAKAIELIHYSIPQHIIYQLQHSSYRIR